ncbi:MAG: DUF1127 domain-containing protein [Azospirillaceae bacterium]
MTRRIDSPSATLNAGAAVVRPFPGAVPGTSPAGGGARRSPLLGRVLDRLACWQGRARMRRALGELDDRMLRDVGLTRLDVRAEAAKPFWRV